VFGILTLQRAAQGISFCAASLGTLTNMHSLDVLGPLGTKENTEQFIGAGPADSIRRVHNIRLKKERGEKNMSLILQLFRELPKD
jgi:hypothetical protein